MKSFKQFITEKTYPRDRNTLVNILNKIDNKVIDKKISISKFVLTLSKSLKRYKIVITKKSSKFVEDGKSNLTGFFDDIDEKIDLLIMYNPKDKSFTWDKEYWSYFKGLLVDVIIHEFTHADQSDKRYGEPQRDVIAKEYKSAKPYNKRDFESKVEYGNNIRYYANPDELEAFSMNAASELMRYYLNKDEVFKALNNYIKIGLEQSPVFYGYNELFKKNSPVMKKFVKLVTHYVTIY